MSLYDYQVSRTIAQMDAQLYAIIMAAMRQADTQSLAKLAAAWPEVYVEFTARYNAPGGLLGGEQP